MKYTKILLILTSLIFAGCASNPMQIASNQQIEQISENESQVVFMRSSFLGAAINASLYEVKGDELVFIGIMPNNTKIPYKTTPGKHTFMVVSEAADFLEADFASGQTYYSLVTPRMGAWKARFSLWPIKNDPNAEHSLLSKNFNNWVEDTKLIKVNEKSRMWFEKHKSSINSKQQDYWQVWKKKSAADIAERTLSPADGT